MMNLPNILTIGRTALVPPFVAFFYLPHNAAAWATLGVFALAAMTDYFDGWLARRLNQTSEFGRILDPIADKLLVASALVMLTLRYEDEAPTLFAIPYGSMVIPVAAILCRELLIFGLRVGLAGRFSLPVSRLGKWKTASQMAAIILMLFAPTLLSFLDPDRSSGSGDLLGYLFIFLLLAGEILLWFAAILSWLSAGLYIRAGWRQLPVRARPGD